MRQKLLIPKTLILIVLIVTILVPFELITAHNGRISLATEEFHVVKNGDYLRYKVVVAEFITSNRSLVTVGADSLLDNPEPIETDLRIDFQRNSSENVEETIITLSFSMRGSGYYYHGKDDQGKITFDYSYIAYLRGNINNNKYYYPNDTEWGYLPFILPNMPKTNDFTEFKLSGSTQYTKEVVIAANNATAFAESPQGSQDCNYLLVQNNPTVFGFDRFEYAKLNNYYIDSDKNILLKSWISDPFWTVFEREFVLYEGNMQLLETNIDLGPESFMPILYYSANILSFLLPFLLVAGGISGFFLVKRSQRIQRKTKKKGRRHKKNK